jgi:hypothetical protein
MSSHSISPKSEEEKKKKKKGAYVIGKRRKIER